jgi:hypothetical protein
MAANDDGENADLFVRTEPLDNPKKNKWVCGQEQSGETNGG